MTNFTSIVVQRDGEPFLKFTGETLAHASSSDDKNLGPRYSGSTGCWTELNLYRTGKGKFICEQIDHSQREGERDHFSGHVCESKDEIIKFFGHSWLAKDLYKIAKIDDSIVVE